MRRVLGLFLVVLAAASIGGAGGCSSDTSKSSSSGDWKSHSKGSGGEPSSSPGRSWERSGSSTSSSGSGGDLHRPGADSAMVGTDTTGRKPERTWPKRDRADEQPGGVLTAGSHDDNLDPIFFRTFVSRMAQTAPLSDLPGKLRGQRVMLVIKGKDGNPVGNARVRLETGADGKGIELTSRSDGRVVFFSSFDQFATDDELKVTITPPDGSPTITQMIPKGTSRWEINLPEAQTPLPANLDLALLLDTTGSMGDELEYLKAEIKNIARTVRERFPQINTRYGLICYRDLEDEYITRTFPFTESLDDLRKNLAAQRAAGGGDEPEAMERGLEEATKLQWRDRDTVRVMFLITDAPPHEKDITRCMTAMNRLRQRGVAIYPIACSGYKDDCEVILRTMALLTGSQFLFLTDDSGVGNGHGEPHIPFYQVQKLDSLMIRMIAGELAGKRVDAEPGEVLRTVGKLVKE